MDAYPASQLPSLSILESIDNAYPLPLDSERNAEVRRLLPFSTDEPAVVGTAIAAVRPAALAKLEAELAVHVIDIPVSHTLGYTRFSGVLKRLEDNGQ